MHKRHIIGAWLSLFAMLMIFAGPLISHRHTLDRSPAVGTGRHSIDDQRTGQPFAYELVGGSKLPPYRYPYFDIQAITAL